MKLKFLLPVCAATVLALGSCKKDNSSTDSENAEMTSTYELSANQGIADNIIQDANEVLNESAVSNNFMGSAFTGGTAGTSGILSCATVTVTPTMGFPKTVVIDFGTTGCTSPGGVTRKGKINLVISDSLRNPGSTATMTFDNYFVNNFKKEGTITWTNTSSAGVKSWRRVCQNGKITRPNGTYFLHFGTQDIVQTMGASTPAILMDDEFSITGGHTVTNAAGLSRTSTILNALKKKTACNWIDQGRTQVQGPNHVAIIDFGTGTCDDQASISIDGGTAHPFTLN